MNWGTQDCLERMVELQHHRGPDDGGCEWFTNSEGQKVGLGSRRLAILDLSPAGRMPMWNERRTICLAYNGEIYNFAALRDELKAKGHRFRSGTDTEVLLRLYEEEGPECVRRLNGMFAFALWDGDRQCLFLARDPMGIKPLYYAQDGERFACASEMKALLELPDLRRDVSRSALHRYMTFLWVPEPETILEQVHKLPAGHYAVVRNGRMEMTQYWDLEFPQAGTQYARDKRELADELRARFTSAVQSQLVSDRPVGAFLSAGLDSTSIVAAARQPLNTYTITFPKQHRIGENTLDDPAVASRVARHFGCQHREVVLEPDVAQLLPKLVWHMDEPVADPAIITAYAVCRAAASESTVLLSGVGGDELFAGYRKHVAHYWAAAYRRLPRLVRDGLIRSMLERLPGLRGSRLKGAVRLARKMARSGSLPPQQRFIMDSVYLDQAQKYALYSPGLQADTADLDWAGAHEQAFKRVGEADFLHQMLYLDTKIFLPSLNLNYNDKMSMASSIEVRVPFLDRELVEFAATQIPPHWKLARFRRPATKHIFRQAMADVLPREVLRQPKAGFAAPVDYWLAHDLREMVDDLLAPQRLRDRGLFNPLMVERIVQEHRAGQRDWSTTIWQLVTLELWMQSYLDSSPAGASSSPHILSV